MQRFMPAELAYLQKMYAPGILNDVQIKHMAQNHDMITPFAPTQIRDGNISYGLTSFGYDARLAPEYKVFTNVNGTLIDPKSFDDAVYVDKTGDHVIIPPNGFALGRTIEYFKVPKDTLVICLGKCLSGDTLISDPESGAIRQMRDTTGQTNVFSYERDTKKIAIHKTTGELINNGIKPVYRLKTKRGLEIKATKTHPFLKWGGWTPLGDLCIGDRIAIARNEPFTGTSDLSIEEAQLIAFMTADGACHTVGSSPSFTKYDENMRSYFEHIAAACGFMTTSNGSIGRVLLVNRTGQGGAMEKNHATTWLESMGLNVKARQKFIPTKVTVANKPAVKAYLSTLFTCDGGIDIVEDKITGEPKSACLSYYTTSERLAKEVQILLRRFGIFTSFRPKVTIVNNEEYQSYTIRTTCANDIHTFYASIGFLENSEKQHRLENWALFDIPATKSNFDTLPGEAWGYLLAIANDNGLTMSQGLMTKTSKSIGRGTLKALYRKTNDSRVKDLIESDVIWDTVESIEYAGEEEVFDYTVPEVHNFVASGIIVHNSTYARCFTDDTLVELWNGTCDTMVNIWNRIAKGETLYAMGYDESTGNFAPALIENCRKVGTEPVLELSFSDKSTCRVTSDHVFYVKVEDGGFGGIAAGALKAGMKFRRFSFHDATDISLTTSIPMNTPRDVYCFETKFGNFNLGNGVNVKNCGAIVNVTPLEPEWEGEVTIEISNTTSLPMKVYGNEGICQFIFLRGSAECLQSYKDKLGKYMGQKGITTPKVECVNPNNEAPLLPFPKPSVMIRDDAESSKVVRRVVEIEAACGPGYFQADREMALRDPSDALSSLEDMTTTLARAARSHSAHMSNPPPVEAAPQILPETVKLAVEEGLTKRSTHGYTDEDFIW